MYWALGSSSEEEYGVISSLYYRSMSHLSMYVCAVKIKIQ